jgi:hypothetical protein
MVGDAEMIAAWQQGLDAQSRFLRDSIAIDRAWADGTLDQWLATQIAELKQHVDGSDTTDPAGSHSA